MKSYFDLHETIFKIKNKKTKKIKLFSFVNLLFKIFKCDDNNNNNDDISYNYFGIYFKKYNKIILSILKYVDI
jgi:hypothetical protein